MSGRRTKWVGAVYSESQPILSECNTIWFYNQGTSVVTINGVLTLQPMQGVNFEQYPNEYDTTIFDLSFDNSGTNNLACFRKIYIDGN